MQKTVLITGGFGFLGRATAQAYRKRGYFVLGMGHGAWTTCQAHSFGFDAWHESDISLAGLSVLDGRYDVVVHCASNSTVAYSLTHPYEAFERTVQSTMAVLEHLRSTGSKARVIYPSSAAVYGAADDKPLKESDAPNPVSPYGYHKLMVEELLKCHSRHFGTPVAIIRFFSIYGPGLAKQLLWDAARKLCGEADEVSFWGTGEETRDWIYMDDAADLVARLADNSEPFTVVNGASGERVTVREVLEQLKTAFGASTEIKFNGMIKPGDPRFYHADMNAAHSLPWRPGVSLAEGLKIYSNWFRTHD
jgi:UDP-glucose 4-epimerase